MKQRKVHVNDTTLPKFSYFRREMARCKILFGKTHPVTGTLKSSEHVWTFSERIRKSSDSFGYSRIIFVNPAQNLVPFALKKVVRFARIETGFVCHQRFANMFAKRCCVLHIHQVKFATFDLLCEGCPTSKIEILYVAYTY